MRRLGPPSERLEAGRLPARIGDKPVPSLALTRTTAGPAPIVSPAGFVLSIPNRSPARARGLSPRTVGGR